MISAIVFGGLSSYIVDDINAVVGGSDDAIGADDGEKQKKVLLDKLNQSVKQLERSFDRCAKGWVGWDRM